MLFSLIARKISRHFICYYDMTCIGSAFPDSPPKLFTYLQKNPPEWFPILTDFVVTYCFLLFFATFEVNSSTNHYDCSNKKNYKDSNRCVITSFYCFCGCCVR